MATTPDKDQVQGEGDYSQSRLGAAGPGPRKRRPQQ